MVVVMVIKEAKEIAITITIVHANRVFLVSFSLNTCYILSLCRYVPYVEPYSSLVFVLSFSSIHQFQVNVMWFSVDNVHFS